MSRIVRCSLIQATNAESPSSPLDKIKQVMLDKHVAMIRKAAADGAQVCPNFLAPLSAVRTNTNSTKACRFR